jgi:SAM-dependent methyltransferase
MSHSNLAALRGEPSYVWRAGQERRLKMIAKWAKLSDAHILIDGCGVGMYASQIRRRYTQTVEALDIEFDRVLTAREETPHALVGAGEHIPFADHTFDTILSHEVIEHVQDDRLSAQEMVRVLKPGGRIVMFCPNRWYPFETHGHYWKGEYHFGNSPLINYLPDRWRNQFAPHVKAYTARGIKGLFDGEPIKFVHHSRIYGGYDNIIARLGKPAEVMRNMLYTLEETPLDTWGLSHLLVVEKI